MADGGGGSGEGAGAVAGGRVLRGPEIRGAAFSALLPGTRLHAHSGTTNARLTVHIGLSIPMPGAARLRVGVPSAAEAAIAGIDAEQPVQQTGQPEQQSDEQEAWELAWAEGQGFVWDDSFAHEVYWSDAPHDQDAGMAPAAPLTETEAEAAFRAAATPRVILLLSVAHPALTPGAGGSLCRADGGEEAG